MGQLRRNPINGQWVIIGVDNTTGSPEEFKKEKEIVQGKINEGKCFFCYGNESKTPSEVFADRPQSTLPNSSGWFVRVVPNRFPALQIEGELEKLGVGIYDRMNGVGAHEVIIEHPDHQKQLAEVSDDDVKRVIGAYRERSVDLSKDKRFKYLLIFKNDGFLAGASMVHSHSQLIALPIVPKSVKEELIGGEEYLKYRDRCVFCDIIGQERNDGVRLVDENRHFISFCPFFPRFPFEIWILPKEHQANYSEIHSEEMLDFARVLRTTLGRIRKRLRNPSYNFMLHTLPLDGFGNDAYHWHLEIIPKLTEIAGFEWGTGFYVNPTAPEDAASWLKEVTI